MGCFRGRKVWTVNPVSRDHRGFESHPVLMELKYYCDNSRHLVCVPYTIDNLHKMAEDLGIKKCWFHKTHYDIPKRRIEEIKSKCTVVTTREIVMIKNALVA